MATDSDASRAEQEPYPPDVETAEQRRRWELCAMAAFLAYGYAPTVTLDRWDLALLHRVTRAYYASDYETGEGVLSDSDRQMLRSMSVL